MKKITIALVLSIFFSVAANAGADGEDLLSKNKPESVKDCFETVNRGIFAFNQFLDGAIFEPVARGYRHIPSPIRADRKISTAMKWLINYSRKRNEKSMALKLAAEILAASKEEGAAVKKKVDTHKMAEANKAFSHFRF